MEPTSPGLCHRFTSALAAAGTQAIYLLSNVWAGWATVEQAAASGRAFCVVVRDDVLALDADVPADARAEEVSACHESLLSLQSEAEHEGISSWLVKSGGPGRRHLWLVGVDGEQHARYSERAKELGFDPRAGSKRIRPPFSPSAKHVGRLAQPIGDVAAFLAALEALGPPAAPAGRELGRARALPSGPEQTGHSTPSVRRKRDLSTAAWGMARGSEIPERFRKGGVVNRHLVDRSVALHCVNSGWTEQEFVELRLAAGTASPKALKIEETSGRAAAESYLREQYRDEVALAEKNPARPSPDQVREALDEIEQQVLAYEGFGRTRQREVLVMQGLIALAREGIPSLVVGCGSRTLSLRIGGGKDSARNGLASLVRVGFLEVADQNGPPAQPGDEVSPGRRCSLATRYRLKPLPISSQSGPVSGGAQVTDWLVIGNELASNHPAFERSALARSGYHTLMAYDVQVPRTRAEAGKRHTPCVTSTHYKKTKELLDLGALRQLDDGRIVREPFDFDVMAKVTGAEESVAARRSRYALEQAQYADFLAVRLQRELDRAWIVAGGVGETPLQAQSIDEAMCPETGELVKPEEAEAWFVAELQRRQQHGAATRNRAAESWDPKARRGGIIHEGPHDIPEDKAVEWLDHLGERVCPASGLRIRLNAEVA